VTQEGRTRCSGDHQHQGQRRSAQVAQHEAASGREDAAAGAGEQTPRRLMRGSKLPAEFGGRAEASESLADRVVVREAFRFQRGYRVLEVVDQFGSDIGDVRGRERELGGHPVQVGGDLVGGVGAGDGGVSVSWPRVQTSLASTDQGYSGDEKRAPAYQPDEGE